MQRICLFFAALFMSVTVAAIEAETPEDSCSGIMRLVEKGKHKEALEEAEYDAF